MENHEPSHSSKRLASWKEIAAHLGRTVRTVQRWERDLGLPVHRVAGRKRDMVYALKHELDAWLLSREGARALAEPVEPGSSDHGAVESVADGEDLRGVQRAEGEPATPPRRNWRRFAAAGFALLLVGGGAALGLRAPVRSLVARFQPPQPHDWKVTPRQLEIYDANGRVLSEFWHGGHLHGLAEGSYRGNRVIFAGYVENDKRRASMAVLDYYNATGFAPSEDPYYECTSCPAGRPLEFFIFPRSELSAAVHSLPITAEFYTEGNGLQVMTRQTLAHHAPSARTLAGVFYKFDAELRLQDAYHDGGYPEVHSALEGSGVLKHRYSRAEEVGAFPVLKWDGKKFLPIPAPADFLATRTGQKPHRSQRATPAQQIQQLTPRESSPAANPARPQP